MATKAKTLQAKDKETDDKAADAPEKDSQDAPSPLLDLSDAAVKKMIKQAKKRGFVTFDQLNEVLPSDQTSPEQIEDIMSMLSDMGINVTEADDREGEEEKDEGEDETDNELVEVTQKAVTEVKKSEPGSNAEPAPPPQCQLKQTFDQFFAAIPAGSLEDSTMKGMHRHERHLLKQARHNEIEQERDHKRDWCDRQRSPLKRE